MKIYFRTLGCEKNTVDSECAAGLLEDNGYTIINDPVDADVIIVNTCGFINDAKQESIDTILAIAKAKRSEQRLIVSGCLSQRYGKKLVNLLPEVEFFLGVNDYLKLPEILSESNKKNKLYKKSASAQFEEIGPRMHAKAAFSSPIKIAEGCNNLCTYCSIPFIRGPYRSRKPKDIIDEAAMLAQNGCKELVIIAQDVTAYGQDFPGEGHLCSLLHDLCKIEKIHWIRLMYCYEDRISDELIQTIKSEPKICNYLDIPIQHSRDNILNAMNRHSTEASIKFTINKLRKSIPDITIRTTLITGFPGETNEDFMHLYHFVKDLEFERLGVFAYSKEDGTPAAKMPNQIRKAVKERRKEMIMSAQKEISLHKNQALVGKTIEVLVEEMDEDGSYLGRSYMDAPEIDNSILFTSEEHLKLGEFAFVYINDAYDYDLVGVATTGGAH
ncbi:MAG: 30S ribosomal protein S12 methylthiotransferase RimO [Clostridia bacterium]|nr:30S ribosomal protein S12 methylthiotransferase RimO [Clostridia bacterium]